MPVACDTAGNGDHREKLRVNTASLPQQGAVGPNVIVHARRDLRWPPATTLGWHSGARGCAQTSPARSRRPSRTWRRKDSLTHKSRGRPCIGPGENDKRYRHHHPTSKICLPVLILKNPDNPILHLCAQPDYNCRCNPDRRKDVRTRYFPSNLQ